MPPLEIRRLVASFVCSVAFTAAAFDGASAEGRISGLLGASNELLGRILDSSPAQILQHAGKAAGGALVSGPAVSTLKGASDTSDLLRAYQEGGTAAEWQKVYEKSFIKGATEAGTMFGPPGRVASAVVASVSYDVSKYYIAPWAAPWLADRWIEQDKKYGLTPFGRELQRLDRADKKADELLAALSERKANEERLKAAGSQLDSKPGKAASPSTPVQTNEIKAGPTRKGLDASSKLPAGTNIPAGNSNPGASASSKVVPKQTTTVASVQPVPNIEPTPRRQTQIAIPSNSTSLSPTRGGPGGISLSRAAAERMPLNISLDGAIVKSGMIVLSGSKRADSIDAALLLTALRTACEDSDPYFSLDPDNYSAWLRDGDRAVEELLARIKNDTQWKLRPGATQRTPSILKFKTIAPSRDYAPQWATIASRYPDLKSRLVFRPEWLSQTRFGEILYRADVLLKELAGGAPALDTPHLRAARIKAYISGNDRTAGTLLLAKYEGRSDQRPTATGGRVWYDLLEAPRQPLSHLSPALPIAVVGKPDPSSELRTLLRRRGHHDQSGRASPVAVSSRAAVIDVSRVFPHMYVRVKDPVTGADTSGSFPGVDEVAAAANRAPQDYAAAYKEYQALVDVFRAYIVAVHARKTEPRLCSSLPRELIPAERVGADLPAYHPSEPSVTVAWYEYSSGRYRRAIGATTSLIQGGVAIGARRLLDRRDSWASDTPLLGELEKQAYSLFLQQVEPRGQTSSGVHYVVLALDGAQQPIAIQKTAASTPATRERTPAQSLEAGPARSATARPNESLGLFPAQSLEVGPARPPAARLDQPLSGSRTPPAQVNAAPDPQAVEPPPAVARKDSNNPTQTAAVALTGSKPSPSPQPPVRPNIGTSLDTFLIFGLVATPLILVLVVPLLRRRTGRSVAMTPQGAIVMPDLSSSRSEPYVSPQRKDAAWQAKSKPQQQTGSGTKPAPDYDGAERAFKNVFAMKTMFDREQMIARWRSIHGGTREEAMRRLVEDWKRDNRSWR